MHHDLVKIYQSDFYDFFKSHGFHFMETKDRHVVILSDKDYQEVILPSSSVYVRHIPNKEKYQLYVGNTLSFINDNHEENTISLYQDFFYHFYMRYPHSKKEILKNYYKLHALSEEHLLFPFLKKLSSSAKELIANIHSLPISIFSLNKNSLPTWIAFLQKEGISLAEQKKFVFTFLKNRKNQLNDATYNNAVRDQLCEFLQFNEEELSAYFPFFPSLKLLYQEVNVEKSDIFEHTSSLSTFAIVNIKKMVKTFSLDNWNESNYKTILHYFTQGISRFYGCESALCEDVYNARSKVKMLFFHDNPQLTQPVIEYYLLHFFKDMKNHEIAHYVIHREFIDSWFQQYKLKQLLPEKTEIIHKPKI